MAGIDKANAIANLVACGWREVPDRPGEPYRLVPPDSLWAARPADFYVYDAEALQELLAPGSLEEEHGDVS